MFSFEDKDYLYKVLCMMKKHKINKYRNCLQQNLELENSGQKIIEIGP